MNIESISNTLSENNKYVSVRLEYEYGDRDIIVPFYPIVTQVIRAIRRVKDKTLGKFKHGIAKSII